MKNNPRDIIIKCFHLIRTTVSGLQNVKCVNVFQITLIGLFIKWLSWYGEKSTDVRLAVRCDYYPILNLILKFDSLAILEYIVSQWRSKEPFPFFQTIYHNFTEFGRPTYLVNWIVWHSDTLYFNLIIWYIWESQLNTSCG